MADVIVIFDLDGTVWDSEPGILACMAHALDGVGHDITTAGDLRSHTSAFRNRSSTKHSGSTASAT